MEAAATEVTYGAWSLVPSLLAIGMALLTRQVYIALFLGVWVGAWIIEGLSAGGALTSILRVADTWLLRALVPADGGSDHMSIALFTILTGGMIGIISSNGGMEGIVRWLSRGARTRRRGQGVTAALGGVVFFDDYANTLIVGNTMRPLTDRLGISREKLAYLVDSTAAPLACIAVATTWIGFEVSLLNDVLPKTGLQTNGFALMLGSIPYSFYPILTLLFIAMLVGTGRDFGPMLKAEQQALSGLAGRQDIRVSERAEASDVVPRALNAVLPILVLVGVTIGGLLLTGEGESLSEILGSADPFKSLIWASLLSLITAAVLSVVTKALTVSETMEAVESMLKPMLVAVIILTFAWAIADINAELHTANYIVSWLGDDVTSVWLPVAVFVIAAFTSFATGSSWGTMGILVPLVLPLAVAVLGHEGVDAIEAHPVMLAAIASVLSGAVWGDHCSPISDTTILSSVASRCSHIEHVRTQMPYAMTVATCALLFGVIPASFGVHWGIGLAAGAAVLFIFLRTFGRKPEK